MTTLSLPPRVTPTKIHYNDKDYNHSYKLTYKHKLTHNTKLQYTQ